MPSDVLAMAEWLWTGLAVLATAACCAFVVYKKRTDPNFSVDEKPWEASKKKGDNNYYYAHTPRANDGLAASDYRMNGPRRLDPHSKRPLDDAATQEDATASSGRVLPEAIASSQDAAAAEKPLQRITKYSWSDTPTSVSVYVEHEQWFEQATVEVLRVSETAVKVTAELRDGAHYALVLSPLRAPVTTRISKKQTAKRLTVKLQKATGGGSWSTLLADNKQQAPSIPGLQSALYGIDNDDDDTTASKVDEVD